MHSNVQFLGSFVGVEKINKVTKKNSAALFVEDPEISDDYGVVRFIGQDVKDAPFKVGDKVYYGKQRQELRMAGVDILVMEKGNIYARVEEETQEAAEQT